MLRRPNMIEPRHSREASDGPISDEAGLDKVDPVWARIRREAEEVLRREPELATFIYSTILHHDALRRQQLSIAWRSGSIMPAWQAS